jgi:Asp-tRNA(Asn)/Glu-tRNA(Gln) amidotransferase C subunit
MKVKHLKTKTTIELTPEEANNLIKRVHDIDQMADTIMECQDLWLSDVSKLQKVKCDLIELLNLEWDRETYRYTRKNNE